MKKAILLLPILFIISSTSFAQSNISVEDIWKDYKFLDKRVPGFNFMQDGKHYARLEDKAIKKYDITTGKYVEDIIDSTLLKTKGFDSEMSSYKFNDDESYIMIESDRKSIFRRSYTSVVHVYDTKSNKLMSVFDQPVMNATLSPTKDNVVFGFENNLYVKNLNQRDAYQITEDGEKNKIINGITDWVYEEEFAFVKAFEWSPDGKYIAYIKFDESEVPEFTMTNYKDELYPEYVTWKYPKVGEKNAVVSVHLYNLETGKTQKVDLGDMNDMYIPRIKWTQDNDKLCVYKMNRHQNLLELYLADANDGSTKVLYTEKNKYYIDVTDDLTFLKDKKHFIWTSEMDGYNHIYLYDMKGKLKNQITKGEFDVTSLYGVDEENEMVYFQAAKKTAMQKEVYSSSFTGREIKELSKDAGTNSAQFSATYDYFVLNHSTINSAPTYVVYDKNGKEVRSIEDNSGLNKTQSIRGTAPIEFINFDTEKGVNLNGWILKPSNFDPAKQYPVFMYLYGGPGSQQVTDGWKGQNYWWFQMLAQEGYIVACIDNRGTGGRGEEFKKMTYLKLGHYETIDQIDAAKYLGALPYTDASRIGIFGWSYGGYMSSLCLLKGNDVFKAAIAVAPVTSWKWYDTIYTERYMRTLEENREGYEENSPIYFADQLKGNYLLVHGMGDDNVHFQNSVEMANALIAANKQFDTYYYPNRNHGIYGGPTRLHLYTKMTNFLLEKL